MSVFMIVQSTVKDAEKYNQYIDQVSPIVEKYGGRYHVRGENIKSVGSWKPERIIVGNELDISSSTVKQEEKVLI